jgi:hypothetical protein
MLQFLLNDERVKLGLDEIDKASLRTTISYGIMLVGYNLVIGNNRHAYSVNSLSHWGARPIAIGLAQYSTPVLFEDGFEWLGGVIRNKITLHKAVDKYLT